MKFAENQVIEIIKKPKNSGEVEKGKRYESKLRIFTEPKLEDEIKEEQAWEDFKGFINKALSNEKEVRISDFILYPLPVCDITEALMSELYKVFNAGNSYFSVETVKKNGGEKLNKVLDKINLNRWIEEQGKIVLNNKPNTVVVVDKGEDGDPYLIAVDNDRLLDIKLKEDGFSVDYVMFIHSKGVNESGEEFTKIALYDEESYHVVNKSKDGDYTIDKSIKHGLGFTPARMFITKRLNSNGELNRKTPLSTALSKLQEWQLFDIYKFYTDHYAPFPIVEMVRAKCGNDNCVNGVLYEEETYYANSEAKVRTTTKPCGTCQGTNQIGVGAKILIDPIEDKDEPSASGKFRMISNDVKNLEYLGDKLYDIEEYIKLKVVGADSVMTTEAVNEKQVKGSFESKTNVLLSIKTNLDELYEWIAVTVAKLSIGDKPINVTANYGTEWYLVGERELQERFKSAKDMGLPREELDMIYKQIIETKYKGNPTKITRLKIINKLDPCPYDLVNDKINKQKNGIISKKDLIISERLITFVNKFEMENGSIVEFGENLTTAERIKSILTIINNYANEYIKENDTEPLNGGKETNE